MITVNIRKQGGAAVITIPADVLKMLDLNVGSTLELDISKEGFTARPLQEAVRKRYSLADLLEGVREEEFKAFNKKTKLARSGKSVGREIP